MNHLGKREFFDKEADGWDDRCHQDDEKEMRQLVERFELKPAEMILVAEDIVTSGKSAKETIEILRKMEGEVIGVTAIGNRNKGNPFDLPFRSLLRFDFPVYKPGDCPLCAKDEPLVKPGSRAKT